MYLLYSIGSIIPYKLQSKVNSSPSFTEVPKELGEYSHRTAVLGFKSTPSLGLDV